MAPFYGQEIPDGFSGSRAQVPRAGNTEASTMPKNHYPDIQEGTMCVVVWSDNSVRINNVTVQIRVSW